MKTLQDCARKYFDFVNAEYCGGDYVYGVGPYENEGQLNRCGILYTTMGDTNGEGDIEIFASLPELCVWYEFNGAEFYRENYGSFDELYEVLDSSWDGWYMDYLDKYYDKFGGVEDEILG